MVRRALFSALVALTVGSRASADEPRARDTQLAMRGSLAYDFGFIALNVTGLVIGTKVLHPARVDRAPLDGLGHRDRVEALGRAADIAVAVGLATGASLSFLGELGTDVRGREVLRGPLITIEGALAGSVFTQLLKNLFGICRPRDWDDATRRCGTKGETSDDEAAIDEAHRSFPSGHSAPLAGMAGAAMGLYLLPSPPRREQLAVALTSLGFAVTVVILRERAGAHSWIDTGGAFISGGLAGLATAALHLRTNDAPQTATAQPAPVVFSLGAPF